MSDLAMMHSSRSTAYSQAVDGSPPFALCIALSGTNNSEKHLARIDSRAGCPRSDQIGNALLIAQSFGGRDRDSVARGQQAGEECAESEERGGCEETAYGEGALHPVGENRAKKAVTR